MKTYIRYVIGVSDGASVICDVQIEAEEMVTVET
jgi:hypothetical protein